MMHGTQRSDSEGGSQQVTLATEEIAELRADH